MTMKLFPFCPAEQKISKQNTLIQLKHERSGAEQVNIASSHPATSNAAKQKKSKLCVVSCQRQAKLQKTTTTTGKNCKFLLFFVSALVSFPVCIERNWKDSFRFHRMLPMWKDVGHLSDFSQKFCFLLLSFDRGYRSTWNLVRIGVSGFSSGITVSETCMCICEDVYWTEPECILVWISWTCTFLIAFVEWKDFLRIPLHPLEITNGFGFVLHVLKWGI